MFPCALSAAGIDWIGDTPAACGYGVVLAQLSLESREALLTLEPGQVAIVLGLENRQIGRQLFASSEIDAMLDDDQSDVLLFSCRPYCYVRVRMRTSPLTWATGTMRSSS